MIHLHVLGMTDLKGQEGHSLPSVLLQPKRLALLAYLVLAHPRGLHRRDKLLALLWPESDITRGRNSLSQALTALRRTLGEEAIVARGNDEVGVASAEIRCDAVAFEEALVAGRYEDALILYRGDLLDGFFVSGAPEFEQWLDAERERLRRRAADAGWRLSDAAEVTGSPAKAVEWAKVAFGLAPTEETGLRRLLLLLDQLGERAEAARIYEAFARQLREEYDVEPSAETQEVLARIRARENVAAEVGALAAAHVAPQPMLNDSAAPRIEDQPTNASAWNGRSARSLRRHGLTTALITLAGISLAVFAVWSRTRMSPPPSLSAAASAVVPVEVRDVVVQPENASDIGAEFVRATIEATLGRVPRIAFGEASDTPGLDVTPYVSITKDSAVSWALIRSRRPGSPTISTRPVRVARSQVQEGITESAHRMAGSIALWTTPEYSQSAPYLSQPSSYESLAAVLELRREGSSAISQLPTDTLVSTLSALHEADPTFTLSLMVAAGALFHDERCEDLERINTELIARISTIPPYEARLMKTFRAWCHGRFEEAVEHSRAQHAAVPHASGPLVQLSLALTWANRPREAYAVIRDRDDVLYGSAYQTGILALHASGDHTRELDVVREILRRESNLWILAFAAGAYAALGRLEDLERVEREAESLPSGDGMNPGDVAIRAAIELAAHGQAETASTHLGRGVDWYRRHPALLETTDGTRTFALALLSAGEYRQAISYFRRLAAVNPQDIMAVGAMGYIAAKEGRIAEATRADRALEALEGRFTRGRATLWRARIANARGRPGVAARLIRDALSRGAPIWSSTGSVPIDDATLHRIPDLQNLLVGSKAQSLELARLVEPRG